MTVVEYKVYILLILLKLLALKVLGKYSFFVICTSRYRKIFFPYTMPGGTRNYRFTINSYVNALVLQCLLSYENQTAVTRRYGFETTWHCQSANAACVSFHTALLRGVSAFSFR